MYFIAINLCSNFRLILESGVLLRLLLTHIGMRTRYRGYIAEVIYMWNAKSLILGHFTYAYLPCLITTGDLITVNEREKSMQI